MYGVMADRNRVRIVQDGFEHKRVLVDAFESFAEPPVRQYRQLSSLSATKFYIPSITPVRLY